MQFHFDNFTTNVNISREIPVIKTIIDNLSNSLIIADENTADIAEKICARSNDLLPLCILKSGEENKSWQAVETILFAANSAGLTRDGIFFAVGGGVICDLTGFAASVFKRGCRLVLIPTTLLSMVDASVGGKTGFNIFGLKNLTGTFYPAEKVYMPVAILSTLPQREWKSGIGELIKTAVLAGEDFINLLESSNLTQDYDVLQQCIEKAVKFKAAIVSEDFREAGKRALLNLGHTFGHALESTAGLGKISHGEAVTWGIVRACELGYTLGLTPKTRAQKIINLIKSFEFETANPHPFANNTDALLNVMKSDKKKKQDRLTFIVPDEKSACPVTIETEKDFKVIKEILSGRITI